jgi:hypothetical protein
MAAMRASCTRAPVAFDCRSMVPRDVQWRSDSLITASDGEPSHASTCASASFMRVGGSKIFGCVTTARNSCRHGAGMAHADSPSASARTAAAAAS